MRVGQAQTALVIGAGIVGLTSALRLRALGLHTTLVDPLTTPANASHGNAGHIAVEQVEPLASWATIRSAPGRLFAFGGALDVRDVAAFTPWLARFIAAAAPSRLRAGRDALRGLLAQALPAWHSMLRDIQRPDLLHTAGHVVLWESEKTAYRRRNAWMTADIGSASFRDLDASELDDFGARLRQRPVGGVRFSGTGQLADVGQTVQALSGAFASAGGLFVQGHVDALEIDRGAAVAVLDGGRRLNADIVLVAAGVASAGLMAMLGPRPPLIAERGYHVQWSIHRWRADSPPVVFEDRALIVTRFHDGLRAASFVEFAQPQTAPDPRKWAALRQHADALGLPTTGTGDAWCGARPTLPDYLPAIGRSTTVSNLLYAFGHQHLGVTLAPITAEIIATLAAGQASPLPLAAFDLQRFHPGARAAA